MVDSDVTINAEQKHIDQLAGVILGTDVGDALGLPRDGLSRRRAGKLFGAPPLCYAFLFGRGMVSDDTEHPRMIGQALLRTSGGSVGG